MGAEEVGRIDAKTGAIEIFKTPTRGSGPRRGMLQEISGGNDHVARDLLGRFQRYNAEDARGLREAVRKGDIAQVLLFSHRIKGSSRTVGANELAATCERVERAARAGDAQAIASGMAKQVAATRAEACATCDAERLRPATSRFSRPFTTRQPHGIP